MEIPSQSLPKTSDGQSFRSTSKINSIYCRHMEVLDYDRMLVSTLQVIQLTISLNFDFQHGLPPMIRKTRPLERFVSKSVTQLPSISSSSGSKVIVQSKRFDSFKKDPSFDPVDIETMIETKVKKLKNNAFLYLMHAVPQTSEHFTPYNLM